MLNKIARKEYLIDLDENNEEYTIDVPIRLLTNEEETHFGIEVDGVSWLETDNRVHATVLYHLMRENLTEYMHYEKA